MHVGISIGKVTRGEQWKPIFPPCLHRGQMNYAAHNPMTIMPPALCFPLFSLQHTCMPWPGTAPASPAIGHNHMHCQLHWHTLLTTHLSLISHPSGGISHEFVFWPHSSHHQTWITAMKNNLNSQCFIIYSSNYYTLTTFCQLTAIRYSLSLLAFIL